MATLITIFTIITGTTSFLGFVYIFFGKSEKFKKTCALFLTFAFLWSAYILFYPSSTVTNVAGKIMFYKAPTIEQPSSNLIIQRGDITITRTEPLSVEFPYPFKDKPVVEIINTNGHDEGFIPSINKVTPHQFIAQSSSWGGFSTSRTFRWVARGEPLEAMSK